MKKLKSLFKGDIHTSMKLFDMYVNSLNAPTLIFLELELMLID